MRGKDMADFNRKALRFDMSFLDVLDEFTTEELEYAVAERYEHGDCGNPDMECCNCPYLNTYGNRCSLARDEDYIWNTRYEGLVPKAKEKKLANEVDTPHGDCGNPNMKCSECPYRFTSGVECSLVGKGRNEC